MIAIISLLIVVTLSILITRIATQALVHTGLSKESARFQARSAFTGAGFTTRESENIVNHPLRRRIILHLIFLGNVGIISAISSLILSFTAIDQTDTLLKIIVLVSGLLILWILSSSNWIEEKLSNLISRALNKYTKLDVRDYHSILHLSDNYRVSEIKITPDDWSADKKLSEIKLRGEGILVLGIMRESGEYIGAPRGKTKLYPGDTMILYGLAELLESLEKRRKGSEGDREHDEAVTEQNKRLKEQKDKEAYDSEDTSGNE